MFRMRLLVEALWRVGSAFGVGAGCRATALVIFVCLSPIPSAIAVVAVPVSPVPGTMAITNCPSLCVQMGGTTDTNWTVSFYARPAPNEVRSNFTIVALPDTQFYVASINGGAPDTFAAQTDWIVAQREASNIVYVAHLGDCVQNGDEYEYQWWWATNAMYRLENPMTTGLPDGIPYGVAVGNHDKLPWTGGSRLYNKYFGTNHFRGRSYYGGHFGTNNDNHYSLFSASGLDFVVVELEYAPKPNVLAWANSVLQAYRDRHAILISHSILNPIPTGTIFNAEGTNIYEAVKGNANLNLMLCGHAPPGGRQTNAFNGQSIYTLCADYTYRTNGGEGWLRVMEFSPSNNVVQVRTFSPTLNTYFPSSPGGIHNFTIPYDLSNSNKGFSLVSVVSNVSPGLVMAPAWTNLLPHQEYEWFIAATNSATSFTSTRWRFTTGDVTPAPVNHPFVITRIQADMNGYVSFVWRTKGGGRYRVEFCDGAAGGGLGTFTEIVRSAAQETDPAPTGSDSFQAFIDDFTLTGSRPTAGVRYYRIRQLE